MTRDPVPLDEYEDPADDDKPVSLATRMAVSYLCAYDSALERTQDANEGKPAGEHVTVLHTIRESIRTVDEANDVRSGVSYRGAHSFALHDLEAEAHVKRATRGRGFDGLYL